ncbi:hypothetical protein D1007_25817 [Hordeum vulgare]|nr:hypothetical protein D1007_25817 [Hordeum vulgare]
MRIIDPTILEAMAFAKDPSLHHIFVATDSKEVMENISSGAGGMNGNIIREIIITVAEFASSSFIFEGRELNADARSLAEYALDLAERTHF